MLTVCTPILLECALQQRRFEGFLAQSTGSTEVVVIQKRKECFDTVLCYLARKRSGLDAARKEDRYPLVDTVAGRPAHAEVLFNEIIDQSPL